MENKLIGYANLSDAVIIEVQYIYPGYDDESSQKKVRVVVDCVNTNQKWERIALDFESVSSFFFKEGKATNQIIDEIKIEPLQDGKFIFDFSQGDFIGSEYVSDFFLVFTVLSVTVLKSL